MRRRQGGAGDVACVRDSGQTYGEQIARDRGTYRRRHASAGERRGGAERPCGSRTHRRDATRCACGARELRGAAEEGGEGGRQMGAPLSARFSGPAPPWTRARRSRCPSPWGSRRPSGRRGPCAARRRPCRGGRGSRTRRTLCRRRYTIGTGQVCSSPVVKSAIHAWRRQARTSGRLAGLKRSSLRARSTASGGARLGAFLSIYLRAARK